MKNSFLIFLTSCILVNTLPKEYAYAVFKIVNLLEHYKHHQKEAQGHQHFWDFLADHYWGAHHEEDHQEHEKLPFQNHTVQSPLQIVPCLLPEAQNIIAFSPTKNFIKEKQLGTFYSSWFSFQNSTFIWQPPEVATLALYSPR